MATVDGPREEVAVRPRHLRNTSAPTTPPMHPKGHVDMFSERIYPVK